MLIAKKRKKLKNERNGRKRFRKGFRQALPLTEDGPVDDVSIREPHFDGVLLVLNGGDGQRDGLVRKLNVTVRPQDHLKGEGTLVLPLLKCFKGN